jgi:hypothetical protein
MQNRTKNQLIFSVLLAGAAIVYALIWRGISPEYKGELLSLSSIVLMISLLGAVIVAATFARKGRSIRDGAFLGAVIGGAMSEFVLGAFGIAAGSNLGNINFTLIGIMMVSVGAGLLWLLRTFPPYEEGALKRRTGEFSAIKVPTLFGRAEKSKAPSTTQPRKQKQIFMSYRREDSLDVAGRIYDRLVQEFGKESIFKDIDSIPFGVDFRKHLRDTIDKCDMALIVVGDRWLNVKDVNGQRRLDSQADFVRIELESALQREIPVIPILVKDARMPDEADLPESLKEFAYRNGTVVRHDPDFHTDMDRLIKALEQR